jgi:uncharacterized RDD family membrane protein YckC
MDNASLGRRIGAMIYDGLLVFALLFLGTLPFIAMRDGESVTPYYIVHQLTLALIIYIFFVGFWTRYSRTLGMQSWGLRIETMDGGKPNPGQATIRFFAALLSWVPLGMGFWWQLFDRENLAWHDRLSGTRLRHYPRS